MALTFFADRQMAQEVVDSQDDSNLSIFAPIMYSMIGDLVPEYAQLVEQAALSTGLYDFEESEGWDEE